MNTPEVVDPDNKGRGSTARARGSRRRSGSPRRRRRVGCHAGVTAGVIAGVALASLGLAGCGGTVVNSVLAGSPPTHGRFATSQASGDYAIAQTAGTVISPSKIQFVIDTTPGQQASATWDLVCNENGGGVGSKSGQATVQAPTVITLPTPGPSYKCIVSVNSQLGNTGTVVVSLYNGGAPSLASAAASAPTGTGTSSSAPAATQTSTASGASTTTTTLSESKAGGGNEDTHPYFRSPSGTIQCELDAGAAGIAPWAYCQITTPAESVTMRSFGGANASVQICRGIRCLRQLVQGSVLGYGQSAMDGPFHCGWLKTTLQCDVALGRGFLITPTGIQSVTAAP
jgi:hypothetical protein